jgi:hypothetical protein
MRPLFAYSHFLAQTYLWLIVAAWDADKPAIVCLIPEQFAGASLHSAIAGLVRALTFLRLGTCAPFFLHAKAFEKLRNS